MQINLEKGAVKNVLDLINVSNGTSLTTAEVALGQPSQWVDSEGLNPRNTSLTVSAVSGSGFTGSVEVRYSRLDLATLGANKTLEYTKGEISSLQSMLEAVATQLGVVAEAVKLDVEAMPVVPEGEASVTCNLVAKVESLLYVGTVPVTVYPLPPQDVVMNEAVTSPDLNGFDLPA